MSGVRVARDGVTMTVCDERTAANLATAGWKPVQAPRKTAK